MAADPRIVTPGTYKTETIAASTTPKLYWTCDLVDEFAVAVSQRAGEQYLVGLACLSESATHEHNLTTLETMLKEFPSPEMARAVFCCVPPRLGQSPYTSDVVDLLNHYKIEVQQDQERTHVQYESTSNPTYAEIFTKKLVIFPKTCNILLYGDIDMTNYLGRTTFNLHEVPVAIDPKKPGRK